MKKYTLPALIFLIIFTSTIFIFRDSFSPSNKVPPTSERLNVLKTNNALNEIPFKYVYENITPSPLKNITSQITSNNQLTKGILDKELYSNLSNLLGQDIDSVGLVYYNIATKEYVSINENKDFVAASTYKVGLNLLYYYLADKGSISLSDTLTYYGYHYQDGTGILAGSCYPGMQISIEKLLDLSIIYSDNIATAMLSDGLGGYNAVREQLYTLLNIEYELYDNVLTPKIAAEILKYIYNNQHIPEFNHLIETMKTTIFHERLDKYIPYNMVAHKIGSIDSYAHDIGFVFTETPYIICIYTEGLPNADEVIASLAKIIYNKNTRNMEQFKINKITYYKF